MLNTKSLPRLSIVVPSYNEQKNIPLILKRFSEVLKNINAELILVNNGSTDNSQKIIEQELKKPEYSFARTVLVPKNIGYGNGIYFGLQQARGDILAYTHADMQCDPLDVIRAYQVLITKENSKSYLIKGRRTKRKVIPQLLTTGLQLLSSLLFLKNFHEINAQPKVFSREFFDKLKSPPLDFNFDFYILYKAKTEKLKIISIPVEFHPRRFGESSWDFNHLSKLKVIHKFVKYLLRLRFLGEEKAAQITYPPK